MISPDTLKLLVCPVDRQPLTEAPISLISRINAAIARGAVRNQAGRSIDKPLDGGLLTGDGQSLYPIADRIPILLADERIALHQLESNGQSV